MTERLYKKGKKKMKNEIKLVKHLLKITNEQLKSAKSNDYDEEDINCLDDRICYLERVLISLECGEYPEY